MELLKVSGGVVVSVFVKPNSERFQLKVEGDELVVLCRESCEGKSEQGVD